jgi:hypothetical protein
MQVAPAIDKLEQARVIAAAPDLFPAALEEANAAVSAVRANPRCALRLLHEQLAGSVAEVQWDVQAGGLPLSTVALHNTMQRKKEAEQAMQVRC